jgi:hypothetical protein
MGTVEFYLLHPTSRKSIKKAALRLLNKVAGTGFEPAQSIHAILHKVLSNNDL